MPDLVGHDRKPGALFARPRRLDGRVKRQEVGAEAHILDRRHQLVDLGRGAVDAAGGLVAARSAAIARASGNIAWPAAAARAPSSRPVASALHRLAGDREARCAPPRRARPCLGDRRRGICRWRPAPPRICAPALRAPRPRLVALLGSAPSIRSASSRTCGAIPELARRICLPSAARRQPPGRAPTTPRSRLSSPSPSAHSAGRRLRAPCGVETEAGMPAGHRRGEGVEIVVPDIGTGRHELDHPATGPGRPMMRRVARAAEGHQLFLGHAPVRDSRRRTAQSMLAPSTAWARWPRARGWRRGSRHRPRPAAPAGSALRTPP